MEKNFKPTDDGSRTELKEHDICSEEEPVSTPSDAQSKSQTHSSSDNFPPYVIPFFRSSFDRMFDEFGLWTLTLTISFVLSGILIPWLFMNGIGEIGYALFVLLLGSISCGASITSLFLWWLLTRNGILGPIRFVVALWSPVLISQLFYALPGSLVRLSYNDHTLRDFVINILICLVLPSLIGSSTTLIGIECRRKLMNGKTSLPPARN